MTTRDMGDDFTELYDATMPRVDIVGKGASGVPRWLVMKGAQNESAGVLDPEFVRDLIAKSPEPSREVTMPTLPNGITVTGSPADVAAFIHKASLRAEAADVAKAELSGKSVNDLPDSMFGYIEPGGKKDESGKTTPRSLRHFPLPDKAHADNAAARIAQGAKFGDKAKPKVEAAQRKFGEKKVSKEAGVPEAVTKDAGDALDMLDEGTDGLDPTVPAAAPDDLDDIPGDPSDPGSAAWEAVDSATATKWVTILAGAKRAVCWLKEREELESVTVDPDDADNACDLATVLDALDYAIGELAPYAVMEQSESDRLAFEAGVAKSAADPVSVTAAVVAIAKAGRVLSSANESRIRQASQHLNDVLASLPQAPTEGGPAAVTKEEGAVTPETETADVAKDAAPADEQARDTAPADAGGTDSMGSAKDAAPESPGREVLKSAPVTILYDAAGDLLGVAPSGAVSMRVAKAGSGDGEKPAMTAVFDADGNLIGICDPSAITPVAGAGKKAADPAPDAKPEDGSGDGDGKPDGAQPGPAAAAAADLEPQPSADAGTPSGDAGGTDDDEDVAKAASAAGSEQDAAANRGSEDTDTGPSEVLKSIAQLHQFLETSEAAHQEVVAKMAADKAEQAQEIEALKARLETVEQTPAPPKVFTNGQVPPAHQLRGQDQGAAPVDVTKARERKAELYAASGPDQARIAKEMQGEAVAYLEAIHAAR